MFRTRPTDCDRDFRVLSWSATAQDAEQKDIGGGVGQRGLRTCDRMIQICGADYWYRFSRSFCSEIPCWNIRFSPPGPRERKVLHHEPFPFLLVDCIIWFGVTATPHKCGNVYARKCTLFLCSPSHYCESSLRRQALHTVLFLETLFGTQKPVWVQNQDGS